MPEPVDDKDGEKDEDLRLENEIKKMKLALEHGSNLISASEEKLPPEIERQWLDYIKQFEDDLARRKKILVYNLIGRPHYRLVNTIPDKDITEELNKIRDLLHKHAITVDTICKVEDRELYRFITEELFREETNDFQMEGMITCFIYEEYHPNHDYDIRARCNEFVHHIMDKNKEWAPDYLGLADTVQTSSGVMPKKEVTERIIHFRDSFTRFFVVDFTVTNVQINDINAQAEGYLRSSGTVEDSGETMNITGDCSFSLIHTSPLWVITGVNIPGVI